MCTNHNTEPLVKSDVLADYIELFDEDGPFYFLREILQINLIIDANVVLADLRWLASKRKKPEARTRILEVLDAKTLKAFAPSYLIEEIEIKLPLISRRDHIDLDGLKVQWSKYKSRIEFVDVGGSDESYSDPEDAPYIKLQEKLNIPIVSKDNDISRMGGRVIEATVIARLRSYSRDAAVEYSLCIGGYTVFLISASLLKATSTFVLSLYRGTHSLPKWVYTIALAVIAAILVFPNLRVALKNFIQSLPEKSKSLGKELIDQVGPLLVEYDRAKGAAAKERSSIENELSKG